jgi:hypothetical protein
MFQACLMLSDAMDNCLDLDNIWHALKEYNLCFLPKVAIRGFKVSSGDIQDLV